jgi:hypothetical protein
MIILGLIFLLVYYLALPIYPLWVIGWILLIVGLVLMLLSVAGRPVGPRRWYY